MILILSFWKINIFGAMKNLVFWTLNLLFSFGIATIDIDSPEIFETIFCYLSQARSNWARKAIYRQESVSKVVQKILCTLEEK